MTDEKDVLMSKLDYYFNSKLPCHIKKITGSFINGVIHSKLNTEIYLVQDLRKNSVRLFVAEIKDIVDYTPKEETKNGEIDGKNN